MVTRYETPVTFWHDLEAVSRGHAVTDLDAVRRLTAMDESYEGPARRDVGAAGLGALVPTSTPTVPTAGVPDAGSRRPFVTRLASSGAWVPFPEEGQVLTVAAATTSGVTGYTQATENTSVTESTVLLVNQSATFVTAVGRLDLSRQAFDRAATGPALTAMVTRAVDAHIERTVLASVLASSSFISSSATTGVGQVRATLEAARQVAQAVQEPADLIVVHPRRWLFWCADASTTSIDSIEFGGSPSIGGIPVVQSTGATTTASTSQDRPHVVRLDGLAYTEDALRATVVTGMEGAAGPGTVSVIGYRYFGFVPKFPGVIQSVSGAGLLPPAAFG